jgi:hypothetical protein
VFQIGQSVTVSVGPSPEFDRVKSVLDEQGVEGSADFGYFVNRPDLFRPSELDERAAMPVLLDLLPTLTDGKAVAAAARHLRRPWAKLTAFEPLVEASGDGHLRRIRTPGGHSEMPLPQQHAQTTSTPCLRW